VFEKVLREWRSLFTKVLTSPSYKKILQGKVTVEEYSEICRQFYFYTSVNPQIQALAAVHFKGQQKRFVKQFFKHAISEIGHDSLALNDLRTLGYDIDFISRGEPSAQTQALISYPFFLIQHKSPVSYLGYLFHLEFAPTAIGDEAIEGFLKSGIPLSALTFLTEHATVDLVHNKLMESYIEGLVKTNEDYYNVVTAMRNTAEYHTRMMDEAIALSGLVSSRCSSESRLGL
jgi:pyrroloquinoline quinone (PQQ) biosynthesis protein C